MMVLVLGDVVVFFHLLQHLHAVAAHVAHGDAPLLRVLAGDLGELDAALLGEGGDRHAHALAVAGRVPPPARLADSAPDGAAPPPAPHTPPAPAPLRPGATTPTLPP